MPLTTREDSFEMQVALEAAWPLLYAAALRHAAGQAFSGDEDGTHWCLTPEDLRRLADEAEAS